tara:strand:- start:1552 stop:3282 length:1731 start_codon:yes stop_codon:yes gene_type:complete
MADPNNSGINASGPFGMEPADTQIGAFGQGMLKIPSWLYETNKDIGDAMLAAPGQIIDYLGSPTEAGQAKMDEEAALAEQMSQFADIEAGADQPNMFFGGPEGEFGGLGVDAEVDDIATTLAALDIMPSTVEGGRGTVVEKPGDREVTVTQEQTDEGFLAAMDDFFESARGAGPAVPEKRTIEEYKKAFSEATGIDTSGKVDKKDALMAFGLALMQNKAGKSFNVSKMLTSVGEAGDKAMPALQRAKNLAREGALAGGKYALQTQSADKAIRAAGAEKAMNRSSYYVYENDPEGKPYGKFDNGKTVQLNKYELNDLINDPNFDSNYSFITESAYLDVLKEKNAVPEYGDQWDKNEPISLIGDDDGPEIFKVTGARRSSNYKGPRDGNSLQLAESPNEVYRRIMKEQENVNLLSGQFAKAIGQIQEGVSIPNQIGSAVTMGLRNLGFDVGDGTTSIKQVKNFLLRIQATNAANILGESGKTLSDNDRKMVANIVGDVNFNTATEEELLQKLGYIYQTVVDRSQANIDTALNTLENEAGVVLPRSNEMSPAQVKYLNERRVASGKKPYTMEEIQKFQY